MPSSRSKPRSVLTWAVREAIQPERKRWRETRTLLGDGLHGDGADVGVAVGLEDALGVCAVGLVPGDVGSDLVGREQDHVVAQLLELPGPEVGGAAGFHDDRRSRHLYEEGEEHPTSQPGFGGDPSGLVRHGDLEDRLCDVHGDHGMLLHGLLLFLAKGGSDTMMPYEP